MLITIVSFSEKKVCATKLETEMLGQGLILESCYTVGFIVIGLLINRIGKFPILCMFLHFAGPLSLIWELFSMNLFQFFTVFILVVSGSGGILCILSDIPLVQIGSFIALMCCAIAGNIVNAATVDIYPTSLR